MTKYIACFFIILSLLGQSLLSTASAASLMEQGGSEISVATQPLSSHAVSADKSQQDSNLGKLDFRHFAKVSDASQCKITFLHCSQIDSGHCMTHSYCHAGVVLPVTLTVPFSQLSSRSIHSDWSSITASTQQDFRPPIA